ncbi:MAG: hypothetical protein JWM59_4039 [Verrucomicrobiales bacterium]|nr:hypothetical protein [Verrucomicrobiales bacterium]
MEPLAAIDYLIPPASYLWRWAPDGSAVEWQDGTTVGLWVELHALLHYLQPQGLPPLGSILLVLMACRQSASVAGNSAREFASASAGDTPAHLLRRLETVLEAVRDLPEDLRSGLPARAHLLSSLFERIPNLQSPEDSKEILAQTDTWGIPGLRARHRGPNAPARLLRDLKAIAGVHDRYDLRSLETRLRTGLEFVQIRPAQLPEPPDTVSGESARPLLRQLEEHSDRELTAVAAVARRLVAMLSLPRPAGFPQELPVGGISDITNRGPLDRLLPSELAADDEVLTARLAHHEALYFRRDSPPDEPSAERVILMDSGIHLWGLPRLYAVAAALGLREAPKIGRGGGFESVILHRREGRLFVPLELASVADVQACLQTLSPDPHAAPALHGFQPEPSPGHTVDVFFLTTPGWREPVGRGLHGLACRIHEAGGRFYVITLSRTGAVELSLHTPAGNRIAATGRIDPGIILDSSQPDRPAQRPKDPLSNLPALIRDLDFYKRYPLPFRFPATPARPDRMFDFAHWSIGVDTQHRLMMWHQDMRTGAGEIAAGLPAARDWHVGAHSREWVVLFTGQGPGYQATALAIGMEEPVRRRLTLDSSHSFPLWMKCQQGAAILGYSDKAEACSLEDGRRLHTLILPQSARAESVVFDGRSLSLATAAGLGNNPETSSRKRLVTAPPPPGPMPSVLGTPVSVGFVASGTLVVRAQGGRWELSMPEFVFKPSAKSQLTGVRPFRRIVGMERGDEPMEDTMPAFYTAEWHPECRIIFDTRGLLHLLFADAQGQVAISLLCLIGVPVTAWVAHWPEPLAGNAEWFLKSPAAPAAGGSAISGVVPLMQRFAALARAAPPVQDWREPPDFPPA